MRGDPYLWEEMRVYFEAVPLPETAVSLHARIKDAFTSLTGHPFPTETDHTPIRIDRLAHGGMSSGFISPDFWRDKAMAELTKRYNETRNVSFQ